MAAPELMAPRGGSRRLRVRRSWVRASFVVLFGVAFGLGLWGFWIYRTSPDFAWGTTAWDVVYYSVQLFVLGAEATNEGGDLPWQLQTARFLAPVATGYAVFEAVRSLFADQFVLMRTRRMRGHAIVVGRTPAAGVIAEALAARGALVARTAAGDAESLRNAGMSGAAVLYACEGEDDEPGVNVLTVAVANRADRDPDLPGLRLNAHVSDPELALALQARHLSHPQPGVDFFTLGELVARSLARRDHVLARGAAPHVAVVGHGTFGRALVVAFARLRSVEIASGGEPLTVTLVGPGAQEAARALRARWPAVRAACRLVPVETFADVRAPGAPQRVYVCHDDDGDALRNALRDSDLWRAGEGAVVLRLNRLAGLGGLFGTHDGAILDDLGGRLDVVEPGTLLRKATAPGALVHDDVYDLMAVSAHLTYLRNQRARGVAWQSTPAMVSWADLSEDLRAANRAQVRAIPDRLRQMGCTVAPASDAEHGRIPEPVVDARAVDEHERWMADKLAAGWTYGPERDDVRRLHPDLRPWDDLSEPDREKDRAAIRAIPVILADFGLHVVPLDDDAGFEAADVAVPDPRGVVRGWRMFGRGRAEQPSEG
ncbi:RyR domain-containing protein [Promicromonospora sp. NPDC023987]|uniref:RyR domain-containing protein n=1 Tax=Promicromonospora sp. NPDC023987 TaxID=3155360 RepID=UPI0033C4C5A4